MRLSFKSGKMTFTGWRDQRLIDTSYVCGFPSRYQNNLFWRGVSSHRKMKAVVYTFTNGRFLRWFCIFIMPAICIGVSRRELVALFLLFDTIQHFGVRCSVFVTFGSRRAPFFFTVLNTIKKSNGFTMGFHEAVFQRKRTSTYRTTWTVFYLFPDGMGATTGFGWKGFLAT